MQTVNEMLTATDADFAAITDADIRRLAHGIEMFEFSPYNAEPFKNPTPEMSGRLEALKDRLSAMRRIRATVATQIVESRCDCGHRAAYPLSSSRGTCCPDCYDRLSN